MTQVHIKGQSIDALVLSILVAHNNIRKIKIDGVYRVVKNITVHDDCSVTVEEIPVPGKIHISQSTFIPEYIKVDLINNVLELWFNQSPM